MQKYNPNIYARKSLRLKWYDYSSKGLYFITICVNKSICLFWDISHGKHHTFESARMIEFYWKKLEEKYNHIKIHDYIVMPNHFHGIIEITKIWWPCDCKICRGTPCGYPRTETHILRTATYIPEITCAPEKIEKQGTHKGYPYEECPYNKNVLWNIIGTFKSETTNAYIKGVKKKKWEPFYKKLWQRNYYEHIIRDESGYLNISQYIRDNPAKWREDKFYITEI